MSDFQKEDIKLFQKYCKTYKYYPLIFPARKDNEEIIAIGDLHGDFDLTLRSLRLAKLIDDKGKWIGGNAYVVQVGDQVDNCRPDNKQKDKNSYNEEVESFSSFTEDKAEDVKILEFMNDLNIQANKVGGMVISLLGNHELMNSMGNMNYVSHKDIQKFKNYKDPVTGQTFTDPKEARIHAFKPGNEYAKLMACSRLPAVIIGSYIFVHAGFIKHFLEQLNIKNRDDLYKISYLLRQWLLGLIDKNNVINIINSKPYSLFWDRILGSIPPNMSNKDPQCVEYLDSVLNLFDVKAMIIGHTPQTFMWKQGINSTCGNKLWRVDFGGSFGFDKFNANNSNKDLRQAQVLRIRGDNMVPEILK